MITVCCVVIVMFYSVKFRKQLLDTSTRKSRDIISDYIQNVLSLRGTPGFASLISSETNQFDQEW